MEWACFEATLKACYRVEQSRRQWLQGVVESLSWLHGGHGMFGFTYLLDAEQRVLLDEVVALKNTADHTQDALIELAYVAQGAGAHGRGDKWFIHGRNANRYNVLIVIDRACVERFQARLLTRLAVHISAGARLQDHFTLQRINRQVCEVANTPPELELVRGKLVFRVGKDGRASSWDPVHAFEANGRHYLVAREPSPKQCGTVGLTKREREILASAAKGHSNKEIAHELGISHSTVRVLLARATKKLHVSDRQGAVKHFAGEAVDARAAVAGCERPFPEI